jgi:hypothetical protein
MGQAAGTAADLALRDRVPPRRVDVRELQRRLAAAGAFLGVSAGAVPAQAASERR